MPSVIYETLIEDRTPLPPGGRITSKILDVRGAHQVSLNVSITDPDADVSRTIFFGPTPDASFAPLRIDDFGNTRHLLTSVPVCGLKVFVEVENQGPRHCTCNGTIYGVRVVP
jgi:hypothetical protein